MFEFDDWQLLVFIVGGISLASAIVFIERRKWRRNDSIDIEQPEVAEEEEEMPQQKLPTTMERLKLAEAWLQVGNYTAAMTEVEQIAPEEKDDKWVLKVRCQIYRFVGDWEHLSACAVAALDLFENDADFWAFWAWSEHKHGRTETALQIISTISQDFEENEVVAYCCACLYANLGRVEEARDWLIKAIQRSDKPLEVQLKALAQPEFETIWKQIQRLQLFDQPAIP